MNTEFLKGVGWVLLALTVIGLVITEFHFYTGQLNADQYVNMQQFLYGGGVLGKLTTIILAAWAGKNAS